MPGLDPSLVAKTLKGRHSRNGHGRCLLERHVRRFERDALANADVLGERPALRAEDLVAGVELRHVFADRLDRAREVDTKGLVLRLAEPGPHAYEVRRSGQEVPIEGIHGSRVHPHQHALVHDRRPLDFAELEDLGWAVCLINHCSHRALLVRTL